MKWKKRIFSLIFVVFAVVYDVATTAQTIQCYTTNLFSFKHETMPYPFLNPGDTSFTPANISSLIYSQGALVDFFNSTARNMAFNIRTSQYGFVSGYLIVQWLITFSLVLLLLVPIIATTVHHFTKGKYLQRLSFYDHRLSRYFHHVRSLIVDDSNRARKKKRRVLSNDSIDETTSTITFSPTVETEYLEAQMEERIESYWQDESKNIVRRFFGVYWIKLRYQFSFTFVRSKCLFCF